MAESSRLNFPYIVSSHILDALVQPVVEAVLLTTPPAGPAAGMLYVIGTAPGGIWSGKGNCLTQYLGETWAFYDPFEGLAVWNKATKTHWYYTGTQWSESKTDQHLNRTDNPHAVTVAQIGAETPAGAQARIDTHTGKAAGAHPAIAVSVAAVGSISATNVQAALAELDTEKSPTTHVHSAATTAANGFMAGSDKQKLDGIAVGAEVNQNAFGTIVAGGVAAVADSKSDTFTITAGSGITITGDATNDGCTIAVTANGHSHSDATASAAGFMPAALVTKLNGITAGAQPNQNAFSNVLVGTTTVAADSVTDTLTLAAGSGIAITPDAATDTVTIGLVADGHSHGAATASTAGFQSAADKQKLDGIAAGAEVNQNAFSTIVAGGVAAAADSKSDTFTITAGSGITITGDATNDACTIAVTANGHSHSDATTSAAGFMPAALVTKINGITAGAQPNQNAFSNILIGTTTVAADAATDTLELVAGSNIALTPDATNDRITIAVTGTVPTAASASICTGNAATATALATARTIGISGDAAGTATSFNGSTNITIPLVLAASGVTAGTYTSVTVDAKGRVTAATNPATISASTTGNAATATKLATARTINGVAFDGTANISIASVATATTANNIPTADVGGNIWIA